jgi:hypothetical protein
LSGTNRRTDRTVQLVGISNAFLSTITLAERFREFTLVMRTRSPGGWPKRFARSNCGTNTMTA